MLKHADDDAGRDPLLGGERPNGALAMGWRGSEPLPCVPGDQNVGRPFVDFRLKAGGGAFRPIDENVFLAVEQDMCPGSIHMRHRVGRRGQPWP